MNNGKFQNRNISEAISEIPDLEIFTDAVNDTALSQTLEQTKAMTVFAPNDNAFAKWPQAVFSEFSKDDARQKDIVSYHLVNEEIVFEGLRVPRIVQSLQGENLSINPINTYTVNNVRVIKPDIFCRNGVIHIIYKVLDPYERV